jgi:hypothetical protein
VRRNQRANAMSEKKPDDRSWSPATIDLSSWCMNHRGNHDTIVDALSIDHPAACGCAGAAIRGWVMGMDEFFPETIPQLIEIE